MLRRTPIFSRVSKSSFNQARLEAMKHFVKTHSTEVPAAQARPTFTDPTSARGSYMSIDTSFADIPEVGGEHTPVPDEVQNALRELTGMTRHDQIERLTSNKMKQKIMFLSQRQEERKKLLLSSSSSSSASSSKNPKNNKQVQQQQQELQTLEQEEMDLLTKLQKNLKERDEKRLEHSQNFALEHFRNRVRLAKSIRQLAEDFNTSRLNTEHLPMPTPHTDIKGLNSGPRYELRNAELSRRRSWFSLRHAFLSAAPLLFGFSQSLNDVATSCRGVVPSSSSLSSSSSASSSDSNISAELNKSIAEAAQSAMAECCEALTWMKLAADKSGKWSLPIEWESRVSSDFDKIDFATLATHLLQQYSNVMEFCLLNNNNDSATATTTNSTLNQTVSLLHLCRQYNVDKSILENSLNENVLRKILIDNKNRKANATSSAALTTSDAKVKLTKDTALISSMGAVALGLICDDDVLRLSFDSPAFASSSSSSSLVSQLLSIVFSEGGGSTLETFVGEDLNSLMEFLLRIKKINVEHEHLLVGNSKELRISDSAKIDHDNNNNENNNEGIRLFNTLLIAAQRRMRILMHSPRNSGMVSSEANTADTMPNDALFPLQRLMDYQRKNNPNFTVLEFKTLQSVSAEQLARKAVNSETVVKFFKLLMDITVLSTTANRRSHHNNSIQQQNENKKSFQSNEGVSTLLSNDPENESDDGLTLVCSAWMHDVVRRAAEYSHGTANSITIHESLSLLETISTAAPSLFRRDANGGFRNMPSLSSSDTFLRALSIIQKTISDHALELTAKQLVVLFTSFVALQPVVQSMIDAIANNQQKLGSVDPFTSYSFPNCMDALEMRLLKSNAHSWSPSRLLSFSSSSSSPSSSSPKAKHSDLDHRLNFSQQTQIVKCLVELSSASSSSSSSMAKNQVISPRLVTERFAENSAKILERLENLLFAEKSNRKSTIGDSLVATCLRNGSEVALSLVTLTEPSSFSSTSSSLPSANNNNNNNESPENLRRVNQHSNSVEEMQLAVLLDNLMRILVTPHQQQHHHRHAPLFSASKLSVADNAIIFSSLLQILGAVPHTKQNLPIVAPCHKICQEILLASIASCESNENQMEVLVSVFLDHCTEQNDNSNSLLLSARGTFKMLKSIQILSKKDQTSTNSNKRKFDSLSRQCTNFAKEIFLHLAGTPEISNSLNFLEFAELWEMLSVASRMSMEQSGNKTNTQHVDALNNQIEQVSSQLSSALEECSSILRRVVLAASSGCSSSSTADTEQDNDMAVVANLDLRAMTSACEIFINDMTEHSPELGKSALRFIVCGYAYLQQNAEHDSINNFPGSQGDISAVSNSKQTKSSSALSLMMVRNPTMTRRLGFERGQLVQLSSLNQEILAQQDRKRELQQVGRTLKKCLDFVRAHHSDVSDTLEVANSEWKILKKSEM